LADIGNMGAIWDFLKVRKIWWITPLVILAILLAFMFLAGGSAPVTDVYAPI